MQTHKNNDYIYVYLFIYIGSGSYAKNPGFASEFLRVFFFFFFLKMISKRLLCQLNAQLRCQANQLISRGSRFTHHIITVSVTWHSYFKIINIP
jgi:hypothetical protein